MRAVSRCVSFRSRLPKRDGQDHPMAPADLDVVRESYDRVADNYAHMVMTTGVGDIRRHPRLKASIDAFASFPAQSSTGSPVV